MPSKRATTKAIESLADLTPDPQNARAHNDRNVGAIASAMQEVGAARSIVIDEGGVVLAGNATVKAAAAAGITKVQVVDADGETLVVVRRSGLTALLKTRLALADNRAAELATWDVDVLSQLAAADPAALAGLWTPDELEAMFEGLHQGAPALTDPDAIPDTRATDIRPGDLFELGRHRLLCGSSTNPADVLRVLDGAKPALMVTDPPYGVEYDPSWRAKAGVGSTKRTGKVANDHLVDWTDAWRLFEGDVAYVYHAGIYAGSVAAQLQGQRFELRAQIIWRKPRFVLSRGHYHWQHEPCWYAVRAGSTASWGGSRKESTTWDAGDPRRCPQCACVSLVPVEGPLGDADAAVPSTVWEIATRDGSGDTTHGTQKPVECMARPMRNHDIREVYEPFSGSGSTLMAAQGLGKRCYAIELEPTYVQQAIDRWEAHTGQKAAKR